MAERVLELTAAYVSSRIQFGGRSGASRRSSMPAPTSPPSSTALASPPTRGFRGAAYLAGRPAVAAAVTGVQLHGGVGMIRNYPLHFYYRRAKAMQLRLGSAAEQLEELARVLVDPVVSGGSPEPWL